MCVYIHTHTKGHYSARKNNEIVSSAGKWMELETIMLSEISQTEKDKYRRFSYAESEP
jgi:hypothetical protein